MVQISIFDSVCVNVTFHANNINAVAVDIELCRLHRSTRQTCIRNWPYHLRWYYCDFEQIFVLLFLCRCLLFQSFFLSNSSSSFLLVFPWLFINIFGRYVWCTHGKWSHVLPRSCFGGFSNRTDDTCRQHIHLDYDGELYRYIDFWCRRIGYGDWNIKWIVNGSEGSLYKKPIRAFQKPLIKHKRPSSG